MQAIFSMLAGMVILGSVIYRFNNVDKDSLARSATVAVFVYLSLAIGLFLSSYGEVVAFQRHLMGDLTISTDVHKSLQPIAWGVSLFLGAWMGSASGFKAGVLTFSIVAFSFIFGPSFWNLLVSTSSGQVITFTILMVLLALLNAALGIIVVGINIAFMIIQLGKGQSIDLFSLVNLIEVIHPESLIISLTILVLSSVLGSLELVISNMGIGGGH